MMEKIKKTIRVVQIMNQMNSGGIESVVLNYYRMIDKKRFYFDFIVCEDSTCPFEEEIIKLGGRIIKAPKLSRPLKYNDFVSKAIREGKYDIVHSHMGTLSFLPLYAAKKAGVKKRICHVHTTACPEEGLRAIAKYLLRPFSKMMATDYFACGKKASEWMFKAEKTFIMANSIEVDRFGFTQKDREIIRDKYQIKEDTVVIGHIGRFVIQKNHKFLIDILSDIKKVSEKKICLMLLGEGKLYDSIIRYAKQKGCLEDILFLGVSKEPAKYYSAMDVFCLPSYYEGVPIVALEAQANGLPLLMSDKISEETKSNDNCFFLPINEGTEGWIKSIERCKRTNDIKIKDIKESVKALEDKYCELMNN